MKAFNFMYIWLITYGLDSIPILLISINCDILHYWWTLSNDKKYGSFSPKPLHSTTPTNQNMIITHTQLRSGGRLNKKDGLTRYGNSHVKDKTS